MNPIPGCRGVETYYIMSFVLYPGAQTYVIYNTKTKIWFSALPVCFISRCWNVCILQHNHKISHLCTFHVLYLKVPNRMKFTTQMQHFTLANLLIMLSRCAQTYVIYNNNATINTSLLSMCFIFRCWNICKLQHVGNNLHVWSFHSFYLKLLKHM